MDLISFLKANIAKKSRPNLVPVSNPKRGFAIIDRKNLPLWKGWGWQVESWGSIEEPIGATKAKAEPKPKKVKVKPEADQNAV